MPLICTCPLGHRWKHAGETPPPPTDPRPTCPSCGATAASIGEDTGAELHAETLTFSPPPPASAPLGGAAPAAAAVPAAPAGPPTVSPGESPATLRAPSVPLQPAAPPPRTPTPPLESRGFPWLAERPRADLPRPAAIRPEPPRFDPPRLDPPRRSLTGPVLAAATLTAALFLAFGVLGWIFWVSPAVDSEAERAEKEGKRADAATRKVDVAETKLKAAQDAHDADKEELVRVNGDNTRLEARAGELEVKADAEKRRADNLQAIVDKLKPPDSGIRPPPPDPKQVHSTFYPDSISLADLELRARPPAPPMATAYLLRCLPPSGKPPRGAWEWHYLFGQATNEVRAFYKHTAPARAVAYSPDGKRIASAGDDRVVRVWDAATGAELFPCTGHGARVMAVAFSRDGKRLASCDAGGTVAPGKGEVRIWDADKDRGKLLGSFKADGQFFGVAFDDTGRLAAACADKTVRLYDATPKELDPLKGHTQAVKSVAFSPDGKLLASGDGTFFPPNKRTAGEIKLWEDGKEVRTLKGHPAPVLALAFRPDGKRLFSADMMALVKIWDLTPEAASATPKTVRFMSSEVRALAAHGNFLFVGTPNGEVGALNGDTAAIAIPFRQVYPGAILALAASPDGARVVTTHPDLSNSVRVRDMTVRKPFVSVAAHDGPVQALAFSPDGRFVASAARDNDKSVRISDVRTGREVRTLEGLARPATQVAFSPDDKLLLTVGQPSAAPDQAIEVVLWNVATGDPVGKVPGQSGRVLTAAFGPDGKRLLLAVPGKKLVIWDVAKKEEVPRLDDAAGAPQAGVEAGVVAATLDGREIAVAAAAGITVHRAPSAKDGKGAWQTTELLDRPSALTGLGWAPKGGILMVGSQRSGLDSRLPAGVQLWNVATNKLVGFRPGPRPDPRSAAVSPDGKRVVASLGYTVPGIYDVTNPKNPRPLLMLRGPLDATPRTSPPPNPNCLAWSPDGWRIAMGASDGSLVLWDATPRSETAAAEPKP
jgi:WD40 repeat protein